MRTLRCRWRIPVAVTCALSVAAVTACGDDASSDSTTTASASTTVVTTAPPSTVAPVTAARPTAAPPTTARPATTARPGTTAKPKPTTTSPPTTIPGQISVTVGVDSSPDRVETVKVGVPITLSVTNPQRDDEFHIHVVDLGDGEEVPQGQTKVFKFTVNSPASIEVESHTTETVLLTIEVVA